ncbi:MAG TPA: DNA primase [Phycisphaerales bacterium]|nr:DNA primase [Phycisphaerales bacterium]
MIAGTEQFDNRRRVLEATEIVALVGEHLALRAKGREFVGLCPFHDDHKPSMCVVPHKQIFHCFSCGAGGNAIDFVMKYHAMDFRAALEFLATRAGIELVWKKSAKPAGEQGQGSTREQLLAAAGQAQGFFRAILRHPEHGAAARAVIEKRGISPEMVELFEIGASADRWDGLFQVINTKGLDQKAFLDAGLLKSRESGGAYDGFRNRVIFPIFDQIGRPIAFGGRKIREEDEPKYLNSPESAIFDKGGTLFALKQAFRSIQQSRTAIITEGYLDAITCHQYGFTNVVATLGTALTERHAAVLRRIADTVVVLFDGDEAGQRAADRAFEVFFAEPVDLRVAVLPDELDPDDLLKSEGGVDRFRAVIDSAMDSVEFRYGRMVAALDASGRTAGSAARARVVQDDITRLTELGLNAIPPIRRQTIIRKLARIAGVDETTIAASVKASKPRAAARDARATSSEKTTAAVVALSHLDYAFGCLLLEPDLVQTFSTDGEEILKRHAYGSGPFRAVASVFLELSNSGARVETATLLGEIEDESARSAMTGLLARVERECRDGSGDRLMDYWNDCVARLKLEHTTSTPTESATEATALAERLRLARERHERLGDRVLIRHPTTSVNR